MAAASRVEELREPTPLGVFGLECLTVGGQVVALVGAVPPCTLYVPGLRRQKPAEGWSVRAHENAFKEAW